MRRMPILLAAALVFVLFAVVAATAGATPAAPERPFKASFEGTREFAADPGRCEGLGEGWNLLVIELTSGNATHLGKVAGTADQCIKGLSIVDGRATYVAANGDELNATYTGTIVSVVGTIAVIEVDQTFDGGTGRFEHAAGDAIELVSVDLVAGSVKGTVEGYISY